ncbi:hypothetical protein FNF29_01741 [Cafeteria roenbergensis]|uniref:Major facilitator superfamily (MFS) profile domain-containing protein n=1 Tax=Cafeteria roenbergensis TaxID=33653 RepID=A0A5A8CQN9_CAFRO|nr:hypothetical protein FNF29_01741 [Cafeteria roenbergensis]|eukprot:KAA0155366.1 hypothetical protein FNF29_01741 [Cafeteria roenbergensis]
MAVTDDDAKRRSKSLASQTDPHDGDASPADESARTVIAGPILCCGAWRTELPAYAWVLPVVLMEYLVLSLVASIVPALESKQFGGSEYVIVGVASGINGLLSVFGTPTIGRLSDALGRKPLMALTVVGSSLPMCILAATSNMWVYESIRAAAGLVTATFSVAFAVAADVTTPALRATAIGRVVATFGISLSIGPLVGAGLITLVGPLGPELLAVVLTVLNAAYVMLVLPETLPPAGKTQGVCKHVRSPVETMGPLLQHPALRLVGGVVFFVNVAEQGLVSLLISYLQRHLGFGSMDIGIFALALGIMMAGSQAFLLPILLKRFETRNVVVAVSAVNALHTMLYGLVREKWQVFCVLVLAVISFLGFPAIADIVSRMVPRERQGQFQGAVTGVRALTVGIGPALFGFILSETCPSSSEDGGDFDISCSTAFFIGAALVAGGAILAMWLPSHSDLLAIAKEILALTAAAEEDSEALGDSPAMDDYVAMEFVSETWTIVADDAPMVEDRTEPLGLAAADEEFLLEEQEAEALGDGVAGAGVKEEAPDEQPPEPSTLWDGLVRLAGIVGWVVVLGVMWLGSLFYNQENVLYHPEQPKGYRSPSDIPEEAGLSSPAARDPPLPFKTVFLATEDGARLHAWMVHAADPDLRKRVPTLVFLHGNAGNMAFRLPNVEVLHAACEGTVNIFMLEYRGYGDSTGRPSEDGLGLDIDAGLKYLRTCGDVDPDNVFVFGRSLGGAVAVRGAVGAEGKGIRGLILENTFTCVSDMVDVLMPHLKWVKKLVLRMHWPTRERLTTLGHLPALFISGGQDELIPAEQMRANFVSHAAPMKDKLFIRVTLGTHNDTWQRGGWRYYEQVFAFVKRTAVGEAADLVRVPTRQWWGAWSRRRELLLWRPASDAKPKPIAAE